MKAAPSFGRPTATFGDRARAPPQPHSVLILDEATSALDSGTETLINETLLRIGRIRTVISVTHRLASAMKSDIIFVMVNGSLADAAAMNFCCEQGAFIPNCGPNRADSPVSAKGDWATVISSACAPSRF